MIYTRQKKRQLNEQLLAQLPPDIVLSSNKNYDVETAQIFLQLSRLPEGAVPAESVNDLRRQSFPHPANRNPVTVVFIALHHIGESGTLTRNYLADYVLPGREEEQAGRIAARRLYIWQPSKPIIYKGVVYE